MSKPSESRVRVRSPAYPAIALGEAVERATEFRQYAGKSSVTASLVLEHWGYKGASGIGMKIIAALGYYGLIDDEGTGERRKVRLTDRALRILLDHEESTARIEALVDAALSPKLYLEMWQEWEEELPPDEEIRSHLIFEKRFNEAVISGVIADYKATLSYVGLRDSDIVSREGQPISSDVMPTEPHETRPAPQRVRAKQLPGTKSIEIPTTTTPWPVLTVEFPMSKGKWDQMMLMLKTIEPAIVKGEDAGEGSGE